MTHCFLHKKMSVIKIIQKCLCNLNKNFKKMFLLNELIDSKVMRKEIEKCIIKGQNNQVRSLEFQNFKKKICSLSLIDILSNLLQEVVRNFHEFKKTTPLNSILSSSFAFYQNSNDKS